MFLMKKEEGAARLAIRLHNLPAQTRIYKEKSRPAEADPK
jgi:hypothetical protein